MEENSCEDETSKSVENVVDGQKPKEVDNIFELEDMKIKTGLEEQTKDKHQVSGRCASSYDASGSSVSGTSTGFSPPTPINTPQSETPATAKTTVATATTTSTPVENVEPVSNKIENNTTRPLLPIYEESQDTQPLPPFVEEHIQTRKGSIGPPPSYSFVMKQKKLKMTTVDPLIATRPPPPAYSSAGARGLYGTADENRLDRMCNLPSFGEPIWRSHSQPAFCARCGVIVLTTTHSHDSIATHLAALALCLFGCWPCCLLPYCMSVCKNTYHHCPVCQAFLGVYSPW